MSTNLPCLEPLLARVERPAVFATSGEDGAQSPVHAPAQGVVAAASTPTPTRSACPTRGCRSYEILNERDNAVAERSHAPWTDLEGELRTHGVPLFSSSNHLRRRAPSTCWFNLSAELTYTNLFHPGRSAGVAVVRAGNRGDETLLVNAGGHCTYKPLAADPVDAFVLAWFMAAEINEVLARWKRAASPQGRDGQRREAGPGVAGVRARCTTQFTRPGAGGDARSYRPPPPTI